jgi:uncharacterized protein
MSSPVSSECFDALPLAVRGATLDREFRLIDLPRLADWAVDDQARAHLSARFHLIEARVGVVGRATAKLRLICQRCLGPVQVPVDDEFHVVLVPSEVEMDQLPEQQDAVVVDATRLELSWLLEEQLLLAMPLVPLHATLAECATRAHESVETNAVQSAVVSLDTQRPFADLKDLLKRQTNKS